MAEKIVQIPASQIFTMVKSMEKLVAQTKVNNLIPEQQAAELLGVSRKTLQNKVAEGKLGDYYTTSPINGARFYKLDKILGL